MQCKCHAGDREQQAEELLALEAIFAEAFTSMGCGRAEVGLPSFPLPLQLFSASLLLTLLALMLMKIKPCCLQVCIPSAGAPHKVTVGIHLPDDYPSASAPVLELKSSSMTPDQQAEAIQHLHELFQPGEVSHLGTSKARCGE